MIYLAELLGVILLVLALIIKIDIITWKKKKEYCQKKVRQQRLQKEVRKFVDNFSK